MSKLDEFLSNPPLFLRTNHVIFQGAGPEKQGGKVHAFYFIALDRQKARYRSSTFLGLARVKADAGVFGIRAANSRNLPADMSGAESFRAVWGGYEAGARVACDLKDQDADLMLTPELTGCAIAWAAQPDGSARFSHYNLKDEQSGRTLGAAGMVDAARLDYRGISNAGVLTKEHYYSKAKRNRAMMRASVIGWRSGTVWSFWIQYVENKNDVHQIRSVEKLRPGTRIG